MKKRNIILYFIVSIFAFVVILEVLRFSLPSQLDDVNPFMNCSNDVLEKSDIYYIVPIYNNIPINNSKDWCEKIKSYNKTLYLHGIYHTYNEFASNISNDEFEYALDIFYGCFGFYPTNFKAPQLKISRRNKEYIKNLGLDYDGYLNQIFHKTYHCNDSGKFSNSFQDLF